MAFRNVLRRSREASKTKNAADPYQSAALRTPPLFVSVLGRAPNRLAAADKSWEAPPSLSKPLISSLAFLLSDCYRQLRSPERAATSQM